MSEPRIKREQSPEGAARAEDVLQYGGGPKPGPVEADEKYPNRPHNHAVTLLFSDLLNSFFKPLGEVKAQAGAARGASSSAAASRAKRGFGLGAGARLSPHEQRRAIISRFIARWRTEVGDDFYPALRLILPEKDRDRGVYGLKENTIGKLLVKLMKIDKNSPDGYGLLHWKLPGASGAGGGGGGGRAGGGGGGMAGDFAGRCYEVLAKRPLRTGAGDLRIGQVNALLDRLAAAGAEAEQLAVFQTFYEHMNPEELAWLIRIVLKEMRIGVSERTVLNLWHPDGEALFSVSSSLRRVCWELTDPALRLAQAETGVALMQCFQPQLAQFQMPASFQKMVEKLGTTPDEPEFWIEEKLDGERMQMHMVCEDSDEGEDGGDREDRMRFRFWSRRAKDYTELYGDRITNPRSALTQHLRGAFAAGVRSLVLDGEMITWDPTMDKIVAFGTLKTAALDAQANPHDTTAPRPLFRVFDILFLNGQPLTRYTLRDRHRALARAVVGVPRRLELHPHEAATSADAIEPLLRQIVADASEGLVLKNPRAMYRLNSRNDDWIKVKPEYMTEFGESLDCVVIGGYFGSGRRGGMLSSFLCGLRAGGDGDGDGAEKCLSFFKVGGGFKAEDYAEIRHRTEGRWHDWDSAHPPSEYVELAGGERVQAEKPDVWIRPRDSIVLSVKAASVAPSDSFATKETLRFPRFRRLRLDRAWDSALDVEQFRALRGRALDAAQDRREMQIEARRQHRRPAKKAKLDLIVVGQERSNASTKAPSTQPPAPPPGNETAFAGLDVCVLSEAVQPKKASKAALEALVKAHGGRVWQRPDAVRGMVVVADKKVVKAASLIKAGAVDIVRPAWLWDCLAHQGYRLPLEAARHLLHATDATAARARGATDAFGDSYARDVQADELRRILAEMQVERDEDDADADADADDAPPFDAEAFLDQLEEAGDGLGPLKSTVFRRCRVHVAVAADRNGAATTATPASDTAVVRLQNWVRFGGGALADGLGDESTTHVVVVAVPGGGGADGATVADIRRRLVSRRRQPRIVDAAWVEDSWAESTRVDEEPYAPP